MPPILSTIILSSVIITTTPNQPTEIVGSAATPNGNRKEVIVEQPKNSPNPFGTPPPEPTPAPIRILNTPPAVATTPDTTNQTQPLVFQTSTTNPAQMSRNPLDYQDKMENTIYQNGNRLLDVQSIPIKDINQALTPNIQPTISNYPAF